jgi:hypothetical protein
MDTLVKQRLDSAVEAAASVAAYGREKLMAAERPRERLS